MDLKKIIKKHFLNLKNINNLQKETEKTIEKFDFNKYLIKNKYDKNKNNTHMEKKDFYENLISNNFTTKNINFYLTNGTNKNLSDGGSGTNKAITDINENFFILDNENNIFCPNMSDMSDMSDMSNMPNITKEKYNEQQIIKKNIKCKNAGAVFYKEIENNKYKDYNIIGVYHINGWNHKLFNVEKSDDYKKLVSLYYVAILDYFFKNIYDKKNFSILHLIQCPGFLFSGTIITTKIFINTICGYLFLKKEELNYSSKYFKISLDYDGDFNIKYKNVKYLSDLINK